MKTRKFYTFVSILAICAFGLLFIGCPAEESDENKTPGNNSTPGSGDSTDFNMAGTYTFAKTGGNCTWVFTADKNYQCSGYGISGTKTGTWSSKGNDVTISYSQSAGSTTVSGEEVFTVQVNGNQLTLTLKDNTATTSVLLVQFGLTPPIKSITLTKTDNVSGGDPNTPFTSISELGTYLSKQPVNTPDSPYIIKLNVNDISGLKTTLDDNSRSYRKYVYIDLSGSTIKTIPDQAFCISDVGGVRGCNNLTGITMPNSVTSIGNEAFRCCYNLTNITIPDSVTSIGNLAFLACTSFTSITIPNSVTSIENGAFDSCTNLASVTLPTNASFTSIKAYAFDQCTSLASVTIPDSVSSIGQQAFRGCTSLANITIPDSVTSIGYGAFDNCTSLTNITIPSSVTSIESNAFNNCTGLTNITIPSSVTSIERNAFNRCTNLTKVIFQGSIPYVGRDTPAFLGDLKNKFYASNSANGTPGTYTTTAPVSSSSVWTKQ